MTIKRRLEQAVNSALGPFGFQVRQCLNHNMYGALSMCHKLGLHVETFIDVGASDGCWTRDAAAVYQESQFLMVEALEERRPALDRLVASDPRRLHYVLAAAGEAAGETSFYVADDLDGSGTASGSGGDNAALRKVKVVTVDEELGRRGLKGPYCLKLDTHGFEVPIMNGAKNTLAAASLVIIEAYNFKLGQHGLLFWELCVLMDSHGFRVADLVSPMFRPYDGLFWQCDLFFVRKDWPAFKHVTFA